MQRNKQPRTIGFVIDIDMVFCAFLCILLYNHFNKNKSRFTLWLQIISRRHSKFSQPAPRGPSSFQDIAAVLTKTRKQSSLLALKFL